MGDKALPPRVELYSWLNWVIQLRNEMSAAKSNAYETLDRWGWDGAQQRRAIRYLMYLESAHSEEHAKRMAQRQGKKG